MQPVVSHVGLSSTVFRLVRLAVALFGDTLGQQPIDTIRHSKIDSTPGWAAVIERKQTLVADGRKMATGHTSNQLQIININYWLIDNKSEIEVTSRG